jgi:hypothetical protein
MDSRGPWILFLSSFISTEILFLDFSMFDVLGVFLSCA